MRLFHRHALVTPGVLGPEQLLSPLLDVAEKDDKAGDRDGVQAGRAMLGDRDDGAASSQNADESGLEEVPSEMSVLEESSSCEDLMTEYAGSRQSLVPVPRRASEPDFSATGPEGRRAKGRRRRAARAAVAPLVQFFRQQLELTLSGENPSPHLRIDFSPVVAASSLLYLPVSLSFFAAGEQPMGAVMSCVTVTSLFSDSLDPASKFWSRLDRFLCSMGAVLGPVKAIVLAGSVSKRAQIIFVCGGSLSLLAWSRRSKSQNQFVVRHTLWHIVSAAALTWLTFAVSFAR